MNWDRSKPAIAALLMLGCFAAAAYPASDSRVVTFRATVNPKARLTLGAYTVTFPDADPGLVSSIAATENAILVAADARTNSNGNVTLTILASEDLTSGSDTIGIHNVAWTATGAGYQSGTLSKTNAQTVGSWTGPGSHLGAVTFSLANTYGYAPGNYTASVTYTLTSP